MCIPWIFAATLISIRGNIEHKLNRRARLTKFIANSHKLGSYKGRGVSCATKVHFRKQNIPLTHVSNVSWNLVAWLPHGPLCYDFLSWWSAVTPCCFCAWTTLRELKTLGPAPRELICWRSKEDPLLIGRTIGEHKLRLKFDKGRDLRV